MPVVPGQPGREPGHGLGLGEESTATPKSVRVLRLPAASSAAGRCGVDGRKVPGWGWLSPWRAQWCCYRRPRQHLPRPLRQVQFLPPEPPRRRQGWLHPQRLWRAQHWRQVLTHLQRRRRRWSQAHASPSSWLAGDGSRPRAQQLRGNQPGALL